MGTPSGVTHRQLCNEVAARHGISQAAMRAIAADYLGELMRHAVTHGRCHIPGLGVFRSNILPARTFTHPKTGKEIQVAAVYTIRFRASRKR